MAKRRSKNSRNPSKPAQAASAVEERSGAASSLLPAIFAFLFGMLLVWSLMLPMDSISVFTGEALTQNLFWLLTAVAGSLAAVLGGGFRFPSWKIGIYGAVLLWLIGITLAAGAESNPRQAWNGFWQIMALASAYFCALGLMARRQSREAIVCLLLVGGVATAVHGLYQVGIGLPQARAEYESNPEETLADLGIDTSSDSPARRRFESRLYSHEPYATFALANSLATLLTAVLVLAFGWLAMVLTLPQRAGLPMWRVVVLGLAMMAILVCWFLARSRAAYVALIASGGYWLLIEAGHHRRAILQTKAFRYAAITIGVLFALGLAWIARNDQLVISEARKSLGFRLEYWQATLHMLQNHGWLGIGLGNFQGYYPQYKLETASETIADPHNWFLDIAVTLSIPVAIAVSVWLLRIFWSRPPSLETAPAQGEAEPGSPQQPREEDEIDALQAKGLLWGAVLGGSACMVLSVLLLGVKLTPALLSWGIAAAVGILIWPGRTVWRASSPLVFQASALSIVVCLLASGSWQASGIAIPLVILLAASRTAELGTYGESGGRIWVWLPIVGLLIFVFQAWRPVTTCWAKQQQASSAASFREQIELARQAVEADPWDTRPLGWLAHTLMVQAAQAPAGQLDRQSAEAVQQLDAWLGRDGRSFTHWQQAGDLTLNLFVESRQRDAPVDWLLEKAVAYYQVAVTRYPSSVELRVQLAAVAALSGDWERFRTEVGEAERISQATPHDDKKLGRQLVWLPFHFLPESLRAGDNGAVRAEPLVNWLRTKESTLLLSP